MRHLRGVRRSLRPRLRLVLLAAMLRAPSITAQQAPMADHHQHLFSPAVVEMLGAGGGDAPPVLTARNLIPLLDSATSAGQSFSRWRTCTEAPGGQLRTSTARCGRKTTGPPLRPPSTPIG